MRKGKSHGMPAPYHRPKDTTWTARQKLKIVQTRSTNTRDEAKNVTLKTPTWEKERDDAHND